MGASIADILSNKEKSQLVLPNINKGDVFKMRLLQDLHYPINISDYPFLRKNSFVCCAELKEITADNFIGRYEGEGRCGKLTNEDLELIIGALKSSPLVTTKQLKRFSL